MRLIKNLLAIVFNALAECFDRLAMACEDRIESQEVEVEILHTQSTNGYAAERRSQPQ